MRAITFQRIDADVSQTVLQYREVQDDWIRVSNGLACKFAMAGFDHERTDVLSGKVAIQREEERQYLMGSVLVTGQIRRN